MTKPAAGRGGRRYALLLALWDSEYAKEVYGGYYNVFVAAFGDVSGGTDERWDCFRVIAGEFPAPEDLASYDGFVVSGSPHDAHGDEPWRRRLCALVQTVHAMRKRVLGICFGHQVLCRALGGRVGRARNGWDVGVRKVTFAPELLEGRLEFLGGLVEDDLPRSAALIEVNQDEVWEIPPAATVLVYSEKTRVEVFAVGERALGIQGHPEYTFDILHNLIDRLTNQRAIRRSGGRLAFWTALCKGFLGGGGDRTQPALPVMRGTVAPEVTSCAVAGCGFTSAAAMIQLARSN
ncbi:gamma-glutamyl peptidase 5-like [Miscanthus floridulus]|uniref:gamma-glutamyl peptidase 5-like n=1 Tax=Miscanthus floridulus TaxID=154761 RepID=UPI003459B2BB